ncbi:hypothetical protein K525DRAFT_200612 [Schizophyllum commune Loenen D]|nr:hypothetical protein K525DRAFT_200612 [Schizophyllum commune Loenen D]
MGRWTQFDEDSYRLPEGFKRVAYDTEIKRYTFVDSKGVAYVGNPGEEYGPMTPKADLESSRPGAFAEDNQDRPQLSRPTTKSSSSFHEFLPSHRIGAAAPPAEEPSSSKQMADVVETVMPKVQGVVQNIRRRFGTTSKREKGKSSPGFLADKKIEGGSPPPVGEDDKLGYGGRAQDSRKARPKGLADEKSPLLSKSGTSSGAQAKSSSRK